MKPRHCLVAAIGLLVLMPPAIGHGNLHPPTRAAQKGAAEQQAWGIAADPSRVTRTITIRMLDTMRYEPSRIVVAEGETVRLRAINQGKTLHEIVLGTAEALAAHADLMKRFPGMEHDEPHMAHVGAGRRGEIVWTFNRPGTFEFACLLPGHYESGMKGVIEVKPRRTFDDRPSGGRNSPPRAS